MAYSKSIPQQRVDLRTVNSFVAARRPTRALRQEERRIGVSEEKEARDLLLMEREVQAEREVA